MKLLELLKLQIFYIILAIGYNIISLVIYKKIGRPLTSSVPSATIIISLLIFGTLSFTALLKTKVIYRVLMGLLGLIIFYNGVIPHVLNITKIDLYYNFIAWLLAIGINIYGTILYIIAALGKFKN